MDFEKQLPFLLNGYIFTNILGRGSFASVYYVKSVKYNRIFAAKVAELEPSFITKEGQLVDPELAALSNLDHPSIIKIYDYFVYNQYLILILDFHEGGTLETLINTNTTLPFHHFIRLASEIANGLSHCANQNIAHRDVKPSNIFLDQNCHAILADFNLASFSATVCNACGSPFYCAPEVFLDSNFDPFKADVYSLGVTFYTMLVGSPPWDEETVGLFPRPEPVFPKTMDEEIVTLIQQMLSQDPNQRPSMYEVARHPIFNRGRDSARGSLSVRQLSKSNFHTKFSSPSLKRKGSALSFMNYTVNPRRKSIPIQTSGSDGEKPSKAATLPMTFRDILC